jgi:hypothetical protein
VHIVNQPFKVGLAHGNIYLEVHPHLEEDVAAAAEQYTRVVDKILSRTAGYEVELSWPQIKQTVEVPTGIPRIVGSFRERVMGGAPGLGERAPLAQNQPPGRGLRVTPEADARIQTGASRASQFNVL